MRSGFVSDVVDWVGDRARDVVDGAKQIADKLLGTHERDYDHLVRTIQKRDDAEDRYRAHRTPENREHLHVAAEELATVWAEYQAKYPRDE